MDETGANRDVTPSRAPQRDRLLTPGEVASLFRVDPKTVTRWASAGRIANAVARPNPETGGWRLSFELVPGTARSAELLAVLKGQDGPLTETWLFRWTA